MSDAALGELLDTTARRLVGSPAGALDALIGGLQILRAGSSLEAWQECIADCHKHPLRRLLAEDPFTRRCLGRPRGYAGDPGLLDLVYLGLPPELATDTSPLGRAIFDYHARRSALARALLGRRDTLRALVETTADRLPAARVLAVGCGHLPEARLAPAVELGRLGAYVALDQDAASLALIKQELGPLGVTPFRATVRELVAGRVPLGRFDLIYAADFYDYLDQATALRLTALLFSRLHPGGDLLLASFSPTFASAAYLGCFLDWPLACRGEDEMHDLLSSIPGYEMAGQQYFCGPAGDISYLAVQKT